MNKKSTQKLGTRELYTIDGSKGSGRGINLNRLAFLKKINVTNAIAVFFILFISINIINSVAVELKLAKKMQILEKEHFAVKQEQQKLKEQIALYKSGEGMEKLARERLGYIKSDEIPVRYIDNK